MNICAGRSGYTISIQRLSRGQLSRRVDSRLFASATRPPSRDPKQLKADQDYCIDLVQQQDREGYGMFVNDDCHYFEHYKCNGRLQQLLGSLSCRMMLASSVFVCFG
jgi:hypothetical protein